LVKSPRSKVGIVVVEFAGLLKALGNFGEQRADAWELQSRLLAPPLRLCGKLALLGATVCWQALGHTPFVDQAVVDADFQVGTTGDLNSLADRPTGPGTIVIVGVTSICPMT
jgi:hypothetical protein